MLTIVVLCSLLWAILPDRWWWYIVYLLLFFHYLLEATCWEENLITVVDTWYDTEAHLLMTVVCLGYFDIWYYIVNMKILHSDIVYSLTNRSVDVLFIVPDDMLFIAWYLLWGSDVFDYDQKSLHLRLRYSILQWLPCDWLIRYQSVLWWPDVVCSVLWSMLFSGQ